MRHKVIGNPDILKIPGKSILRALVNFPILEVSWRGHRPHPVPHSLLSASDDPQFQCTPPTPADIIFLVDGSWSIGHNHFQQVKDFLASIITHFAIGPDKVQVGGCCLLCPALVCVYGGGIGLFESLLAERW